MQSVDEAEKGSALESDKKEKRKGEQDDDVPMKDKERRGKEEELEEGELSDPVANKSKTESQAAPQKPQALKEVKPTEGTRVEEEDKEQRKPAEPEARR